MRNKPFFCLCFFSLYFVLHHLKKTNRKRRWLSKNMLLANLLARALLTKKPEDSGYEIGYSALVTNGKKLFFFSSTHDRMWARCLSLISSIKTCYIILIQHLNHLCSEWGMSFYIYTWSQRRGCFQLPTFIISIFRLWRCFWWLSYFWGRCNEYSVITFILPRTVYWTQ